MYTSQQRGRHASRPTWQRCEMWPPIAAEPNKATQPLRDPGPPNPTQKGNPIPQTTLPTPPKIAPTTPLASHQSTYSNHSGIHEWSRIVTPVNHSSSNGLVHRLFRLEWSSQRAIQANRTYSRYSLPPCTDSAVCCMDGVVFHIVHHFSGMRFWARPGNRTAHRVGAEFRSAKTPLHTIDEVEKAIPP